MASGYPHRMRFRAFSTRYRALWGRGARAAGGEECGAACAAVLRAVAAAAAPPAPSSPATVAWALGKRHVFLSEGMRQVLERMRRARRTAAAECIQAAWRRHRSRPRPSLAAPAPAPRPRPAPIAGTPPPDSPDKCDPALVKRTCSLFGLDLVNSRRVDSTNGAEARLASLTMFIMFVSGEATAAAAATRLHCGGRREAGLSAAARRVCRLGGGRRVRTTARRSASSRGGSRRPGTRGCAGTLPSASFNL